MKRILLSVRISDFEASKLYKIERLPPTISDLTCPVLLKEFGGHSILFIPKNRMSCKHFKFFLRFDHNL